MTARHLLPALAAGAALCFTAATAQDSSGPAAGAHGAGSGVQLIYFESTDGGPVQLRLRSDSGNRRVLAVDNGDNVKTQVILDDGEVRIAGETDNPGNRWLTIGPDGLIAGGPLYSAGDGAQVSYLESTDGGPVQLRLRSSSGNRRVVAVDSGDNVKSQIVLGDGRVTIAGETDNAGNTWLTVGPEGVTTMGPTCSAAPCDAVFDPEAFEPLSIEEHADRMWADRFLGAVGPTGPGTPVNLTEKLGGVIHELEVAHIYIEDLNARLVAQDGLLAEQQRLNARLLARIEALEAAGE